MKTGYTILRSAKPMVCDREDSSIDWPDEPSYDTLIEFFRRALADQNAWMERVRVYWPAVAGARHTFQPTDMIVDEEGMLKGLPINMSATALYVQQYIVNGFRGQLSPICGTAIVFHRPVFF